MNNIVVPFVVMGYLFDLISVRELRSDYGEESVSCTVALGAPYLPVSFVAFSSNKL
jgi:hypothetical protein